MACFYEHDDEHMASMKQDISWPTAQEVSGREYSSYQ